MLKKISLLLATAMLAVVAIFAGEFDYLRDINRGITPYEYFPEEHMKLTFDDHVVNPPPNYQAEKKRAMDFLKARKVVLANQQQAKADCRPLNQKLKKLEDALGRIKSNSNMGDADWDIKTSLSDADSFLRVTAEKSSGQRQQKAKQGRAAARTGFSASMRFQDRKVIKNAKKVLEVYQWLAQDAGC